MSINRHLPIVPLQQIFFLHFQIPHTNELYFHFKHYEELKSPLEEPFDLLCFKVYAFNIF